MHLLYTGSILNLRYLFQNVIRILCRENNMEKEWEKEREKEAGKRATDLLCSGSVLDVELGGGLVDPVLHVLVSVRLQTRQPLNSLE